MSECQSRWRPGNNVAPILAVLVLVFDVALVAVGQQDPRTGAELAALAIAILAT